MIALARTAGAGPESIWVFQADGSGFVEVATTAETRGFDWSPDSARIAYSDLTDPDTAVLYLVDADGTDRVPFNAEGRVEWPSWSPDGSRIAYGFLGLGLSDPQVEIVALDGSGGPTFSRAERAEWSPDGSRLILHALRGLLVVEAGGGGAHLPRALDGCDVQWGPDGARLLWACPEPGRTHVFTTFLDGRGAHDVAIADAEVADLDWQPLRCTVTGTDGNDVLVGHSSGDVICGLGGDDTLTGGRGDDVLIGGEGDDDLTGGQDNDWLVGNGGADHFSGGEGDDVVIGTDIGGADGGGGGPGLDFCPADPYDTLGNCET
jgi:hypothetical protein